MSLYNKVQWVLGISMVFFLILMTNLIDRNQFVQVRDSITTIYQDRLIANDLIIKMLKEVHEKELQLELTDTTEAGRSRNLLSEDLETHIASYEETKLTREESIVFQNLKRNLIRFVNLEEKLLAQTPPDRNALMESLYEIKDNLHELSDIQVIEGRNQMLRSQEAVETVELFTQIEIYILILLAVLVQIIVMYKPK